MKSKYYKFILLSSAICISQINVAVSQGIINPCGTVEKTEEMFKQHPELRQAYIDYNNELNQKSGRSTTLYTIPVVFHVIHVNGAENVSDANIIAQVGRLNTDFRKLNTDLSLAPASFQAIAGDALIQFKLAQIDPNGNCTNGIERIYSHKTFKADDYSKLNQWPRDKYFNVWVVNDIPPGSTPGTILAYATFPSSVNTYYYPSDGVIMISSQCNGSSRTLTHEVGHWLNLEHTWGNAQVATVCGDDGVSDTPITKGHFSTCPSYDSICTPGTMENINNYMDYSSCTYMFTQGQVDRMRIALESTVAQRSNLWITSNLIATGTDGSTYPACTPTSNFYANKYSVCPGGTVTFTPNVLNSSVGTTNTYSWSFPGGTPATSTAASPIITYSTPGIYDVALTITNSGGGTGATVTKNLFIKVSQNYADVSGSYSENFDNSANYYSKWSSVDMDNNYRTWWLTSEAGYSGSQSVKMNAFYNYSGDVDQLFSPSYDLSFMSGVSLTFRCAAATKATVATDITDNLKVYSSVDCGATWALRKTFTGAGTTASSLINNSYHPEEFIPSSVSQWALLSVTVPSSVVTANTRFKFEYTAGLENNTIFIDDVNITGTVGVNDNPVNETNIFIFPNPANQTTTLSYHLNKKGNTKIELIDVLGKKIMEINNNDQSEGDYTVEISKHELNLLNGIYFVKLSVDNGNAITKKLIITE